MQETWKTAAIKGLLDNLPIFCKKMKKISKYAGLEVKISLTMVVMKERWKLTLMLCSSILITCGRKLHLTVR